MLLAGFSWTFVTRLLAESGRFVCDPFSRFRSQPSGNTGVHHEIHSDCHVTMRTGESMQRVKLVAGMPCPHTLWFSRCWCAFLTWGPAFLKCCRPRATLTRHCFRLCAGQTLITWQNFFTRRQGNVKWLMKTLKLHIIMNGVESLQCVCNHYK